MISNLPPVHDKLNLSTTEISVPKTIESFIAKVKQGPGRG